MSWATGYIETLKSGEIVKFRPYGNSMSGKIESGNLVTVEPANEASVTVGDVVLCKVNGKQFLHFVKAFRADGQCQIGNNKGGINGWTKAIYGRVIAIEP